MKKTRYTEEQIAFALKQAETGTRGEELCRKMGISEATFYNWKKKFGGMGVIELRTRKCSRMSFEKSFEARPEKGSCDLSAGRLPNWSAPWLQSDDAESHGVQLP